MLACDQESIIQIVSYMHQAAAQVFLVFSVPESIKNQPYAAMLSSIIRRCDHLCQCKTFKKKGQNIFFRAIESQPQGTNKATLNWGSGVGNDNKYMESSLKTLIASFICSTPIRKGIISSLERN